MLGLQATVGGRPARLADLVRGGPLEKACIATADHCFGCTAGQGSSCTGALGEQTASALCTNFE